MISVEVKAAAKTHHSLACRKAFVRGSSKREGLRRLNQPYFIAGAQKP